MPQGAVIAARLGDEEAQQGLDQVLAQVAHPNGYRVRYALQHIHPPLRLSFGDSPAVRDCSADSSGTRAQSSA